MFGFDRRSLRPAGATLLTNRKHSPTQASPFEVSRVSGRLAFVAVVETAHLWHFYYRAKLRQLSWSRLRRVFGQR